ncbi:hypothetical protein [Allorhodopirellula heiligendammensis]|uniref:Uncharacterized protein n=1 Tax=Allorhodopirellula heiligendammensis TaxID=2714739 RepID=A0A5C6BG21_9BACT|nr:hypothetical protein [Allorhodopirellula heiligendammensis]TWU10900.1 hypothetical protein Poly21_48060 [Allorhodopirellula heiligendammensis]
MSDTPSTPDKPTASAEAPVHDGSVPRDAAQEFPVQGAPAPSDPHADKYNDPRAHFGRKGWAAVVAILIGASIFTAASIYARRTRLGETTRFWGAPTIEALQLGDHVMLLPLEGSDFEPVELTAFPGLGHLRKALLDERHYDWSTETSDGVSDFCEQASDVQCVRLEFSDPTLRRFPMAQIDLELNHGVVGPTDQSRRVSVNDRVRPALKYQIGLLTHIKQESYDHRD